jgi:hypothetical protein
MEFILKGRTIDHALDNKLTGPSQHKFMLGKPFALNLQSVSGKGADIV